MNEYIGPQSVDLKPLLPAIVSISTTTYISSWGTGIKESRLNDNELSDQVVQDNIGPLSCFKNEERLMVWND